MKVYSYFVLVVLLSSVIFAQTVNRLHGSPYPASVIPDTIYTINSSSFSNSELLTIATLQGLLAQTKPRIYQIYNTGASRWLDDLKQNHVSLVNDSYKSSFPALINKFKSEIKGYALCTLGDNSANVAISLCGLTQSVAITESNVSLFNSLGIPQTADVRDKNESWFFDTYGSSINKNILIYQREDRSDFLSDYAVFGNMIMFFEPLKGSTSRKIFQSMNAQSALLGWGDSEFELVSESSASNIFVHPADWAKNISTLSNFNVDLKQKQHIKNVQTQVGVHTVCFLFSDGDNIQWILNEFGTNTRWYASPKRKNINLGWTLPPALSEVAPTVLSWIYDQAETSPTGRDYFVAGPSGLGYVYPDKYKDLGGYTKLLDSFMDKADMRIVNIIGNSDADSYLDQFLRHPNTDAIFFYYFSNYSGGGGKVRWVANKPVIYGRYNFWDGFESATSLATKLNRAAKDPYSAAGYSLIPVHNWSRSVDDVMACINLLDDNIRIVAPDEFVALIKTNLKPVSSILEFLPTNNADELQYLVPEYPGTGYDKVHRWADGNDKIIYKFPVEELMALSAGQNDLRLKYTVSNEYVVSVASAIDSEYHVVSKWSGTDEHIHDDSNRARVFAEVKQYLDLGWENLYVIFEDGIKDDGWGASLTHFQIFKSDLPTTIEEHPHSTEPSGFQLYQNYPNPFNPSTTIEYSLKHSGCVRLEIYDVLGQHVQTLVYATQQAGHHKVAWNGFDKSNRAVSSGIYLCRLSFDEQIESKKMILAR